MVLKTEKKGDVLIIFLEGRLDVYCTYEVEKEIFDIINKGEKKILLNLKELRYLSSNGLRVFVSTLRMLNNISGALKITEIQKNIEKMFKNVEFYDIFEIYSTEREAIKSFS